MTFEKSQSMYREALGKKCPLDVQDEFNPKGNTTRNVLSKVLFHSNLNSYQVIERSFYGMEFFSFWIH